MATNSFTMLSIPTAKQLERFELAQAYYNAARWRMVTTDMVITYRDGREIWVASDGRTVGSES